MKCVPLVGAALCLCAPTAHATLQYNVGLVPALGYQQRQFAFDGSVVAALMFGQARMKDVGFGPRAEVGTFGFETFRATLGPSLHVPVWDPLACALSLHAGFNRQDYDSSFGIGGRGFIGVRPYNHIGSYSATGGIVFGVDHWFGLGTGFSVGAQLDAMWLALPVMALLQVFRD